MGKERARKRNRQTEKIATLKRIALLFFAFAEYTDYIAD
jgi:hypothetical protein